MTYPDGEVVTFDYNNNMLPVSVDGTSVYAQTIAYDSANRMIQMIRGANKIDTVFTYNNWNVDNGRLQNITSTQVSTGDPLQNLTYDYDSVGNIETIVDSLSGPQTQAFTYDALRVAPCKGDRLTNSSVTGGTDGLYTEGYTYEDPNNPNTGNLFSKNGVTYTYSTTHKHAVTSLSNGNTYGYDQNGNMTSRHVFEGTQFKDYTLNYDAENRLVSVTGAATASFVYDGDGKQIKATVNGITAVYVGNHYEVKNSIVTKYYFAGATRIAVRKDGTLNFLLSDHLGSSSVTTDANGAKTASALYKAFGETRYTLGSLNTDYKFTGQREEASLGIYFFNARWYDGSLGRFLSPDTIVPTSTQGTQAWDRYAFVNNNPVRYTDPSGHGVDCGFGEDCVGNQTNQNDICADPDATNYGAEGSCTYSSGEGDGEDNSSRQACGYGGTYDCPPAKPKHCLGGPCNFEYQGLLHPSNIIVNPVVAYVMIYSSDGKPIGYQVVTYVPDRSRGIITINWDGDNTLSGVKSAIITALIKGVEKAPTLIGKAALPPVLSVGFALYQGVDLANNAIVIPGGHIVFEPIRYFNPTTPTPSELIAPMLNPFPIP